MFYNKNVTFWVENTKKNPKGPQQAIIPQTPEIPDFGQNPEKLIHK